MEDKGRKGRRWGGERVLHPPDEDYTRKGEQSNL